MSPAAAPHLFTVTGNLLAERTLAFDTWTPGRTQRARSESFQVGGKGINVSKMLLRLGAPTTALAFTGGAPGAECEAWLRARGFPFHTFATSTPTRTGTVVRTLAPASPASSSVPALASTAPATSAAAPAETTFLGPDAAPDAAAIRACAEFLDAQPAGAVLALCGSFPGWASAGFDPLRAALARWLARGPLVADTYGPPLVWAAAQPLALIKINADELRAFAPDLAHLPTTATASRWVVTDGPRTVSVRDTDGTLATLTPPAVREVSATGSGDVLFACVLHALYQLRLPLREAVTYALPYAAANAAHPGVAEFPDPSR
ncbi:MAG: PfkB family carbohydrate kinase [Verrucomicrobia bacterium]|nr:PfkB family carbohydrate kinase [Verrucomicrobiota bacterium]